jgi:hypothetical protein
MRARGDVARRERVIPMFYPMGEGAWAIRGHHARRHAVARLRACAPGVEDVDARRIACATARCPAETGRQGSTSAARAA